MLLDGLVEMADDMVADIAVDHSARARDIDFLYCAIVDRPVRLRLDTASRDIRIADAARAREETAAGMVEASGVFASSCRMSRLMRARSSIAMKWKALPSVWR